MQSLLVTVTEFLGASPKETTIVRLLESRVGRTQDAACGSTLEEMQRLAAEADGGPWLRHAGVMRYVGTYLRPNHVIEPCSWTDTNPPLGERYAKRWLCFLVDVDPEHRGRNASNEELDAAHACADEIIEWARGVLGADLSCFLELDSGNGDQIVVRVHADPCDVWAAEDLLLRMNARWPLVDQGGARLTVGPALPGTWKRKHPHSDEYPQRMVTVRRQWAGERRLTVDDLRVLRESLPPVAASKREAVPETLTAATPLAAVNKIDIERVMQDLHGRMQCPACGCTDGSFGVIAGTNRVCCMRAKCPAKQREIPRSGWSTLGVVGEHLFGPGWWGGEQLDAIVEFCDERWGVEVSSDIVDDEEAQRCQRIAESVAPLAQPTSRHRSIVPVEQWRLPSRSPRLVAELVADSLIRAYAPSYRGRSKEVLTCSGLVWAYHEGLGVWITPLKPHQEGDELHRLSRVLLDQERDCRILAATGRGFQPWAPPTRAVYDALAEQLTIPDFFARGVEGLCCSDGFLRIVGSEWTREPHSPKHRARGRLDLTCADLASGRGVDDAVAEFQRILDKLLWNQSEQYRKDLTVVFLEQLGAALCRLSMALRRGFIFFGERDTGKSALIQIAEAAFKRLGLKCAPVNLSMLNAKYPPVSVLDADILLSYEESAFAGERAPDSTRLKLLLGGEPWQFDRKYLSTATCTNDPMILWASNHAPRFSDTSEAVSKRMILVQFPLTPTSHEKQDGTLAQRFIDRHLDGLIGAAVRAAVAVRGTRGTVLPESELEQQSRTAAREMPVVEAWLTESADWERCAECEVTRDEVMEAVRLWGVRNGYEQAISTLTPTKLTRELTRLRVIHKETHGRRVVALKRATGVPASTPDIDAAANKGLKLVRP